MSRSAAPTAAELADQVAAARTRLAVAEAELAELCVRYADTRTADDTDQASGRPRLAKHVPKPGAFAADELSLLVCRSPMEVSRLLARTRRLRTGMPETATAATAGVLDGEQLRVIDQTARLAQQAHTLTVLDDQIVDVARQRTPQQLRSWLQRFLARHEPSAAEHRRQVSLSERRVTVAQSVTGIGYITGEVSAEDAAAIDHRLTRLAWALGSHDPRTPQQRRSDIYAGLLLGTLHINHGTTAIDTSTSACASTSPPADTTSAAPVEVLEVESIDPDTGELLHTNRILIDADGNTLDTAPPAPSPAADPVVITERAGPTRIGIVVPLSSLLGLDDTPGELTDRTASIPAQVIRDLASQPDTLFTRLLVDTGGRLLDTTELGPHPSTRLADAIRIRTGTCAYPTCPVPARHCDLDHHHPTPTGPTTATNLDPLCRRHHRGKTFAGLAAHRDQTTITWTLPTAHTYQCHDEPLPLPTGRQLAAIRAP